MKLPPRERLLFYVLVGAIGFYLVVAGVVLVDDMRCRRLGRGRWAKLDQLISDAEENAAILRSSEGSGPG